MSQDKNLKRKRHYRKNIFTKQPPLGNGTAKIDEAILKAVDDLIELRRLLNEVRAKDHALWVSFMIDDLKTREPGIKPE